LAPAKDGVGLDGIAIGADDNVYVTTYIRPHCSRSLSRMARPARSLH